MQTTIVIHVAGPPATAVRFTPVAGTLRAPVAIGTVLGTVAIDPAGWTGNISVSGADAASLSVNASLQLVAAAALAAHDYSVTLTTQE